MMALTIPMRIPLTRVVSFLLDVAEEVLIVVSKEDLSLEELTFLESNGFEPSDVFDATGLKRRDYLPLAREAGARFVINASPCRAHGHTLRGAGAGGHCCLCRPLSQVYRRRYSSPGYVYLACSSNRELVKIGFTSVPDQNSRTSKLNSEDYGSTSDWKMIKFVECKLAGAFESWMIQNMSDSWFRVSIPYIDGHGTLAHSRETFKVHLEDAIEDFERYYKIFCR